MKKIILLSLAAATTLTAAAQSKLDLSAASLASRVMDATVLSRSGDTPVPAPISVEDKVSVIVTLAPGEDASVLEERGYEVIAMRENMAIVRMTAPEMLQAADMVQVKGIALSPMAEPKLLEAKKATGVDVIFQGGPEVGGKAYDGTGIIVGLMDQGLDINNPNFLDDQGASRASRVFVITGSSSAVTTYDTPDKIAKYGTDNSNSTHATHVLGCMAGSFTDKFTRVSLINPNTNAWQLASNRWNANTDYRGPAINSEIAAACGTTEGNNILVAAEKIYNYAKSQNKPAVMNISLGHNYGPHDGTDANSRYLASVGNDMLICVSAGNEGDEPVSLHKDFTDTEKEIKTFPATNATVSGSVDIWGNNSDIYSVTFQIYRKKTGQVVWSYTLDKNLNSDGTQESQIVITSERYNQPYYIHNEWFDKAFGSDAAIFMSSNVDPNNNRYNVQLNYQLGGGKSGYLAGILVEGKPGTSVDLFANGGLSFTSNDIEGYEEGNPDNSINGIATAHNVFAIGAYINATTIPTFEGIGKYPASYKVGNIASFSSYGTTFDGRMLPVVAGPGLGVVSSLNSYYTAKLNPEKDSDLTGATAMKSMTRNNATRDYYWTEMSGTSMSSPFVAGIMALWLQADPTLKYQDVLDVINTTSIRDAYVEAAPHRFGAGRIDALAGIKKILNLSGIADVIADGDGSFVVTPVGQSALEVFAAGAQGLNVELYSLSGMLAGRTAANGDTAVLDASDATPGVYILRSTTANGRVDSRKVVLK